MDKNKEDSVRALVEEMFNIQVKSNRFMKLLTHDQDISENLVLLLLKLKLFGFLKITEISDAFLLTPGAATNMCDKLEQLNFIERIRLKEDRRVVRVTLTKKGEERVDEIFSKFSVKQLETIARTLSEINHLFKNIEKTI
ncbi:DNA-binding MarR family transcriptional regulator [Oikeobacillus pervagus]|uniref:DNA-binding MarR family transcriptional regulator n=1 Tax=Oikeobacillus pervagus TaxID=1325931 RepID=A0AAJ1T3T7_9BACI|nr:MarR family transcriptional regulator [Oikeobacillus pervagus]MDQ0216232.1 DNA-binding MarR family transcriptional regulator [Oikeobacillus pervagus]